MARLPTDKIEDLKTMASDRALAAVLDATKLCDDQIDHIAIVAYVMGTMFGLTAKTISEGTGMPVAMAGRAAIDMMEGAYLALITNREPPRG